ncbi:MAG: hypothetical protein KDC32_08355 [Saprospiraceae bacterium]|nr:hypothetical protein [Saprospiraceae bacterium]
MSDRTDREERLDELIRKYRLLHQPLITVQEESGRRTIVIPFIDTNETVWK